MRLKDLNPWRKKRVVFAGNTLTLDTSWKHERKYFDTIRNAAVYGSIAIDAWVFGHFVKRGSVVLDAGANIGFTSLLAKGFGATEIHCFEPDPRLIDRLREHCQGPEFQVYEMALGERAETLQLCLSATHNQGSTLSDRIVSRYPKIFRGADVAPVQVGTIDHLFGAKHFDLLKIDVEGAELATLKGAADLLRAHPPRAIYIEAYAEFFADLHAYLKATYAFCYRVVCDRRGYGRLHGLDQDVDEMDADQFFTTPPSYVFTSRPVDEFTTRWTAPVRMTL